MARAKKKQKEATVETEVVVTEEVVTAEGVITAEEAEALAAEIAQYETVSDEAVSEDAVSEEAVAEEGATEETAEETAENDADLPPMTQEDVRLVEAMLFATASALSVGQIAERFPADRVKLIPHILEHLKEQYSNRGVNLVQRNARWALRTATDLGDQLRVEKEQPKKFTRSAMETMAIIAYHQPVTRAEIENIRGVATAPGALDALMEAGWIKPGKRREVPGRPVTWLSTQGFLDHFGLEKLEDLPGMDELKAAGLLDKRPAIEAMPPADLFDGETKDEEDPQEVTDEDLVGKVTEDGQSAEDLDSEDLETEASAEEESDFDNTEEDDESGDEEDEDSEDGDEEEDDASDDDDDDDDEDDEDGDDDFDDLEEEDDEDDEEDED